MILCTETSRMDCELKTNWGCLRFSLTNKLIKRGYRWTMSLLFVFSIPAVGSLRKFACVPIPQVLTWDIITYIQNVPKPPRLSVVYALYSHINTLNPVYAGWQNECVQNTEKRQQFYTLWFSIKVLVGNEIFRWSRIHCPPSGFRSTFNRLLSVSGQPMEFPPIRIAFCPKNISFDCEWNEFLWKICVLECVCCVCVCVSL